VTSAPAAKASEGGANQSGVEEEEKVGLAGIFQTVFVADVIHT